MGPRFGKGLNGAWGASGVFAGFHRVLQAFQGFGFRGNRLTGVAARDLMLGASLQGLGFRVSFKVTLQTLNPKP